MAKAKRGLRRALLFSFAQKYTSLIFNLFTIIIVSRILTPSQIGVFSVAIGLTVLAQMLRSLGVPEYLVQEQSVDDATIRTSFTVSLIIAWSLAGGLFATSGWLGHFYGDPGVGQVLRVLSGTFVLTPFGTITTALLKRDLAFGTLYKINMGYVVASSGCTVGLALFGFGYMSMAWASLVANFILVLGCAVWGRRYRVRGLSLSQWRRVVPFGAYRTAADIVIQVGEQSSNLVVGKMIGMAAAGFYSRGYSVVNIYREKVVQAIGAVAFPAFAREHREREAAPDLYLQSIVYLTGISWPFFGFAALMTFPIIRILFGPQWGASVPLMRWLCIAAMVGTLIYQCDQFFTAIGRVGVVTKIETQYQLARVAIVVGAALISLEAVAASQVIVYVLALILYYRKLIKYEELSARTVIAALLPSGLTTVTTCIGPLAVLLFWPGPMSQWYVPLFVVAIASAGAGWLAGLYFTRHPLFSEIKGALAIASGYLRRDPGFK